METGLYYFMVVAEERSVSKAAAKLYVTQQAVSDQMKRLEIKYNTTLFHRKPQFVLTSSGEALLAMARKISILEEGLDAQLDEIKETGMGTIRFGIHSSRARWALAEVLQKFRESYPKVQVETIHSDTQTFEQMLLEGRLDLALAVEPREHKELCCHTLGQEAVYMAAEKGFLKERLGHVPREKITKADLEKLPLIVNPSTSNLRLRLDAFFERERMHPEYVVSILDFDVQMRMAELGIGACFCPAQIGDQYRRSWGRGSRTEEEGGEMNSPAFRESEGLSFLRIEGLEEQSQLALLTYKNAYQPLYLQYFLKLMEDAYRVK